MNAETRRLKCVWHIEAKMSDGKLTLTFHGATSTGNEGRLQVTMDADLYPYVAHDIASEWAKEREWRIRRITTLDNAMPKGPTP